MTPFFQRCDPQPFGLLTYTHFTWSFAHRQPWPGVVSPTECLSTSASRRMLRPACTQSARWNAAALGILQQLSDRPRPGSPGQVLAVLVCRRRALVCRCAARLVDVTAEPVAVRRRSGSISNDHLETQLFPIILRRAHDELENRRCEDRTVRCRISIHPRVHDSHHDSHVHRAGVIPGLSTQQDECITI